MVTGVVQPNSDKETPASSGQSDDSVVQHVVISEAKRSPDFSIETDDEVDWAEEKENDEGDDDEEELDELSSDDEQDCCLDAHDAVPGAAGPDQIQKARAALARMPTMAVLDGDEEGEQGDGEEGEEQPTGPNAREDPSGSTAEAGVQEDAHAAEADDAEEVRTAAQAQPEPRADGFMACNSADNSGVTMRRELSWTKPKAPAKAAVGKEARSARADKPSWDRGKLGARTASGGGAKGDVLVEAADSKRQPASDGRSAYEVRWLIDNAKFLPIHVKVEISCDATDGVTGDVGAQRLVVAEQSSDVLVARVHLRDKTLLPSLSIRWWFGLGNPDAAHNNNIRYSLPFSGKPRHVCQAFGGKYSHTGRLHYSVDVDLPCGHQVRACRSGVVQAVCNSHDKGGASRKYSGMANYVHILHSDGTVGCYLHFQHNGVTCRLGSKVKRGQVIGFIGLTGFTSRPHIHFHVKRHGDFFAGTEWETVPFVFKSSASKGLVLKKGCWYENRAGVAAMTRAARPAKGKKKASASAAAQVTATASA